jgi:biopolymer transport protein ExbB/TolQ
MIGAFKSIAEATDVNAQIVANGIYEALITTVFGLIIALIAMVAHSLFTHIVDTFAAEVEKTCSDLLIDTRETWAGHIATEGYPQVPARRSLPAPSQGDILSLEEYT